MYVFVFKSKSGHNQYCLAGSDSPVHEPIGAWVQTLGDIFLKRGEAGTTLTFVLSHRYASSHVRSYTVYSGSGVFRESQKPVMPYSLSHLFLPHVYLHIPHIQWIDIYKITINKGEKHVLSYLDVKGDSCNSDSSWEEGVKLMIALRSTEGQFKESSSVSCTWREPSYTLTTFMYLWITRSPNKQIN